MGNEKKSKNGSTHQALNPLIIQALIGKFYWIQIQYAFYEKVQSYSWIQVKFYFFWKDFYNFYLYVELTEEYF